MSNEQRAKNLDKEHARLLVFPQPFRISTLYLMH